MSLIELIGIPLGYIMSLCHSLTGEYFWAIILFTLATKIILLPVSIWVQLNGVKSVKITPELNRIKINYFGDADKIADETSALYKREKYSPFAGLIPLLVQVILLLGMVSVIRGISGEGSGLMGMNISAVPSEVRGWSLLVPLCAATAATALTLTQNRSNPLQAEQSRVEKLFTGALSIGISLFLGLYVQVGVGFYWIVSNLMTIAQQVLLNIIINPKKHIDYAALESSRRELAELQRMSKKKGLFSHDENSKREKADYKRFFSIGNKHLVFYSERGGFYKYFENTIEALLRLSNLTVHYITSDPDDSIFELAKAQPRIKPYYIGERRLITLFMKMDADMVVMTMTDLGNYHFKRSYIRKDIEYVYMFHWATSVHMVVSEHALDNYDTVMCVGPHQIAEIREMERIYNLPEKRLIECGYGVIENCLKRYEQLGPRPDTTPQIVIAPSWQEDNIFESCADELLARLLGNGWRVVMRPHPEYLKRYPAKTAAFSAAYAKYIASGELVFETDFSSSETIYRSDVLITDWSTVALEYSFSTKRPTLYINTKMKVMNKAYERVPITPTDITWRNQIGRSVNPDELDRVPKLVRDFMANPDIYRQQITDVMNSCFFNFGHSGDAAASYIIKSLKNKQARKKGEKNEKN